MIGDWRLISQGRV